eukprot:scaffold75767_cov28-Tisochrysis_lutea.AAC.4
MASAPRSVIRAYTPRSSRRLQIAPNALCTTLRNEARSSGEKVHTSDSRLRNSGGKCALAPLSASSAAPGAPCSNAAAPMLDVRMTTVFLKSTTRPFESVSRPSSSNCSSTGSTRGCAFSISSSRTTVYGFFRTASVSWPPSSCPT